MKDLGFQNRIEVPSTHAQQNGKRSRDEMNDNNYSASSGEDGSDNDSASSFEQELSEVPGLNGMPPRIPHIRPQREESPIYERVTRSTSHVEVDPQAPLFVEQQIQETPIVAHVGSRRTRGPTRGLMSQQLFDKQGKLPVYISPLFCAPVGDNACKLSSKIGLEVRTSMTDLTIRRWKAFDESVKAPMVQRVKDHFDMKGDPNDVDKIVATQFGRRLSAYTYRLHKKYKSLKSAKGAEYARNHPPYDITLQQWTNLIDDKWSHPKFKIQSVVNTENRSKMKAKSRCGTRSIPVRVDKMMQNNNKCVPKLKDIYESTHYNLKTKQWISPQAQENYEKIVQTEAEYCSQDGTTSMTQEELSIKVLKPRSGYVKGLGMRPSSSLRTIGAVVDNNEHVLRLESIIEEQKEELEVQKDKIARILEYLKQLGNEFTNIL